MPKIASGFAKVIAVVFSGVVAPIVVDLTLRDIRGDDIAPARKEASPAPRAEAPGPDQSIPAGRARAFGGPNRPAAGENAEMLEVFAHGAGTTPNEALRDAFRAALCYALAARVDAVTWTRNGSALYEEIVASSSELIGNWKEVGASKQWRLRGTVHHRDVAVEINCRALANRLRVAQAHLRSSKG